jgi:hypothetical protein
MPRRRRATWRLVRKRRAKVFAKEDQVLVATMPRLRRARLALCRQILPAAC